MDTIFSRTSIALMSSFVCLRASNKIISAFLILTREVLIMIPLFLSCSPIEASEPDIPKVDNVAGNEFGNVWLALRERADRFRQTHGNLISAFISTQQISRLPAEEQTKRISKVYEHLRPVIVSMAMSVVPNAKANLIWSERSNYTPSELAERLIEVEAYSYFYAYGKASSDALLKNNLVSLSELVAADLRSSDLDLKKQGLNIIRDLGVPRFYKEVAQILKHDPALETEAAYALRSLNEPRAIPILVNCDRSNPMKFFEILRFLSRSHSADATIIRLLDDKNPEIRWRAAYTLAESGDFALLLKVRKLVNDQDARVRQWAGSIPFFFSDSNFKSARAVILPLLNDQNQDVKAYIAVLFAHRKDRACAQALLDLVKDETLDQAARSNVIHAIQNLTGSTFGYYIGNGYRENRAAIRKYEEWVAGVSTKISPSAQNALKPCKE